MPQYKVSEIQPGEEFVWNCHVKAEFPPGHLRSLKTLRRGVRALDIDGNPLPPEHYAPVFIQRSESEALDRLLTERSARIRGGRV